MPCGMFLYGGTKMENNENFTPDEEEVVILLDEDIVEIPVEVQEEISFEEPSVEEKPVREKPVAVVKAPQKPGRSKVTKLVDEYEDEEDEEDDDDEDGGILGGVFGKLLICFGIAIAILAILVGIKYLKPASETTQKVDFSSVGGAFASGEAIGGGNIKAITDAQSSRLEMLQDVVNNYDYEEADEETGITTVDVTLTSILKDLKIKFVNKKNKLIAGVPFKAVITKPDGTTMEVSDDDKDGIIYLSDIDGGAYTVKLETIDGLEGYYDFTTNSTKSATVKTQLDYKKVDVSNEVKTATEEVSKKEDTKKNETEVESKKTDTVAYVVSDKQKGSDGYVEINKSQYITDPVTRYKNSLSASISRFAKLAEGGDPGTPPAPAHSCSYSYTSNGDGTHNKTCTVGGADCPNPQENNIPCTNDGTGHCTECHGEIPSASCTHANKTTKYEPETATTHKIIVTCDDCHETVSTETNKACTWDEATGKCVCGNTKPAAAVSGSVTLKAKDSTGAEKTTLSFSKTDATKNKGTLTATLALNDGVDKTKFDITYAWNTSDANVIKLTENGKETVTFEILKGGDATIQCNVTCKAKEGSGYQNVDLIQLLPLKVEGVSIAVDAEKKMVFVGESINIAFSVSGGATNKLEYSLNPAGTGGYAGVVVSDDTKSVTINGQNAGTFELTAKSKDDPSVTKKVTVYVYTNPKKDTVTKLTTDQGQQVYKMSGSKYVEATLADYYDDSIKLYIGGAVTYKYTGWWTIDGKTYYFDSNGKKVTGKQIILGAEYEFDSNGVLKTGNSSFGIDVSTWNGTIDWNKVSKSGVTYAIIRCGFRGSTQGGLYKDNKFDNNIKNATSAGIKVGVYFFTQAVTEAEAIEEASMCIGLVEAYKLSYPIFIDVESSGGRADSLSKEARTAVIKAFCKTVTNAGYKAGVYANKNWLTTKINTTELTDYTIWLAQYAKEHTYSTTRVDMWQYSASGSINGITGEVDLNLSYIK